jgi:hypothetical protein
MHMQLMYALYSCLTNSFSSKTFLQELSACFRASCGLGFVMGHDIMVENKAC